MAVERQTAVVGSRRSGKRRARAGGGAEARKALPSFRVTASQVLDSAAGAVLALALIWAPLPYGSNRPWSWSLLATAVGLALALAGAAWVTGTARRRLPMIVWPAMACTGAVWIWAWVQTLPVASLPSWAAWAVPHPFWREAESYGLG